MKPVKRNRDGAKKTRRKIVAKRKAILRGHAPAPEGQAQPRRNDRKRPRAARGSNIAARPSPPAARPPAYVQDDWKIVPPQAPSPKKPAATLPRNNFPESRSAPRPRPALRAAVLAIVGRPNVGKSTLFNRLTGSRRSIVGDEPGITRDRIYGEVEWIGRTARVVDTGGIVPDDQALIPAEIFRQARTALDEADAIIMVVDGRSELAAPDIDLARLLQKTGKPLFLAVNKIDTQSMDAAAQNFRRLGIRNVVPISAEHGNNIGDLLDDVFAVLPAEQTPEVALPDTQSPSPADGQDAPAVPDVPEGASPHRTHGEFEQRETAVAIIGRPNVGKSTLLNALTGSSRAIVSPVAGTTRDAVDEVLRYKDHDLRLIDTAGIRRKGKTRLMAEKLSVVMARRHLEAADVALLVLDATEGVTASDATIGGYAHESGRSVIIIVNKWDLVTTARTDGKPPADAAIFERQLRTVLKYLSYAPVLFISAVQGRNIPRVLDTVLRVAAERRKRVSTGQMNRFLDRIDFQRASVPMAKRVRIYYMTQAAVAPPTFVLFTDRDVKLHFSFERFLENQIRAAFDFEGSPIWFKVRARNPAKQSA
ncbi:MAG TPA: ribosome biogenesis GTPase Der [Acidobacteriaceae bacterium]|nr:ribosome biogenesis GTPase Der [Acidobacteriaceae bacterium]